MPDVFISYKREDRPVADALADRLARLGLDVWHDRALRAMTNWRSDIDENLARAKVVLALWSPAATKSKWVNAEAARSDERDALLSVVIRPCRVPSPFNLSAPIDLTQWRDRENESTYWQLVEALAERLRDTRLREYAIQSQFTLSANGNTPAAVRSIEFFDYSEMKRQCESLRDVVREFDPDLMLAADQRAGLWAEMLYDLLQRRVPVIVGYRGAAGLPGYFALGDSFLPSSLLDLRRDTRILLVNDRAGAEFALERDAERILCGTHGFAVEKLCCLALTTTSDAVPPPNVHVGKRSTAASIVIFYDVKAAQEVGPHP
jgi:hypothetical protein